MAREKITVNVMMTLTFDIEDTKDISQVMDNLDCRFRTAYCDENEAEVINYDMINWEKKS